MIQRIQSVWLLLAGVAAFLSFQLPFYTGKKTVDGVAEVANLEGGSNFIILILTGAVMLLALVTIFLYKNRKMQLNLSILGIVLGAAIVALYFMQIKKYESGSVSLTSIVSFAIPVFFFLALKGIWKDEKLVKNLDRLR